MAFAAIGGAKAHYHGQEEGHRSTHCTGVDPDLEFTNRAGEALRLQDGYYLANEADSGFT